MTKESDKLKLLYLLDILEQETDPDHGLSMPQIIERLKERGVSAERKALYRDFDRLREFGVDVEKRDTKPVSYGIGSRPFSSEELMLMADAIQSSRFLTRTKALTLVKKIQDLGSRQQGAALAKRLHVEQRVRMQNEGVFHNMATIQEAIDSKRKIKYRYFKYDLEKRHKLQHDGEFYVKTPVYLIYSDRAYYCVVYDDAHKSFSNYRVDRMTQLSVSEEPATTNDAIKNFDIHEYEARSFSMYNGDPVQAVLEVTEPVMSAVIDRFGTKVDVFPSDDAKHARVSVNVMRSPTFFSWVAQFGPDVKIIKPASLASAYAEFLEEILDSYREDD